MIEAARARPLPTHWLVAALLLCTTAARGADAAERLVVAWDSAGDGLVATLALEPPFSLASPVLALDPDARVRAGFGRVTHLSRQSGVLSIIDPRSWTVEQSFDLGAASLARDVVAADATTLYVARRDARYLLRIDLDTGQSVEAVDLAPLGAGTGNPVMETMLVHEGRLYVQLAGRIGFPDPNFLGVVDLATEQIVDADPVAPGLQAIPLAGTAPRFKMQVVPGTDRLMLSSTGAFQDFGGLELVDLTALQSLGVVVREFFDVVGNDLGAFAMIDDDRGWLVFSTDIVLSSHLHPFTISGGGHTPEADNSLFYFAPHIVYHAATDTIFWPEPQGVQAFDATTGVARAAATPLSGAPTDLALLADAPQIPALPPAALVLAWGVFVATVARAKAFVRRTR